MECLRAVPRKLYFLRKGPFVFNSSSQTTNYISSTHGVVLPVLRKRAACGERSWEQDAIFLPDVPLRVRHRPEDFQEGISGAQAGRWHSRWWGLRERPHNRRLQYTSPPLFHSYSNPIFFVPYFWNWILHCSKMPKMLSQHSQLLSDPNTFSRRTLHTLLSMHQVRQQVESRLIRVHFFLFFFTCTLLTLLLLHCLFINNSEEINYERPMIRKERLWILCAFLGNKRVEKKNRKERIQRNIFFWGRRDLNTQPSDLESDALPFELRPPHVYFVQNPPEANRCFRTIPDTFLEKRSNLAEDGFDPSTCGLWARRASAAPLCRNIWNWICDLFLIILDKLKRLN